MLQFNIFLHENRWKVANLAYKKTAWINPDSSNHQKRNLPDATNGPLPRGHPRSDSRSVMYGTERSMQPSASARPPMMAHHRIGDSQTNKVKHQDFSYMPFWTGETEGHKNQMMADTGDPMASLAVDGWTGDEVFERNSTLTIRSSEQLMSDEPAEETSTGVQNPFSQKHGSSNGKNNKNNRPKSYACTVLEYRWPFVELPSWYVDLREQTEVNGVVIYTAGHGRGETSVLLKI